eukprot:gnl/MRDRNA2_/MRDRNA2_85809_c0_seq2.p1 gnl/MRDRNA2_/MRDRNA2_85809_c0~~gnl/MRDRNA2_/MRDRNA2_85809_c0_seq2.p1  ORF type:complete len:344 (-),score=61.86 gnl/MRDRNA2_/MRDRNA2_85809_c0_seq2:231-1262(-)
MIRSTVLVLLLELQCHAKRYETMSGDGTAKLLHGGTADLLGRDPIPNLNTKVRMGYIKVDAKDGDNPVENEKKAILITSLMEDFISHYEFGAILLGEVLSGLLKILRARFESEMAGAGYDFRIVTAHPGKSGEVMMGIYFCKKNSDSDWNLMDDSWVSKAGKENSTKGAISKSFENPKRNQRVALVLVDLGTKRKEKLKEVNAIVKHLNDWKKSVDHGQVAVFIIGDVNCRICLNEAETTRFAGTKSTGDVSDWVDLTDRLKAVPWQSLDQLHCNQTAVKRAVEPINEHFTFHDGAGAWTYKRWCPGGAANSYANLYNGCQECKKRKAVILKNGAKPDQKKET